MPKPILVDEDENLVTAIIDTFLAGHKEWRPDLPYPESHSDMKAGAMALLRMFKIERRPISIPNRVKCNHCKGAGKYESKIRDESCSIQIEYCGFCNRKGYTNYGC